MVKNKKARSEISMLSLDISLGENSMKQNKTEGGNSCINFLLLLFMD